MLADQRIACFLFVVEGRAFPASVRVASAALFGGPLGREMMNVVFLVASIASFRVTEIADARLPDRLTGALFCVTLGARQLGVRAVQGKTS